MIFSIQTGKDPIDSIKAGSSLLALSGKSRLFRFSSTLFPIILMTSQKNHELPIQVRDVTPFSYFVKQK